MKPTVRLTLSIPLLFALFALPAAADPRPPRQHERPSRPELRTALVWSADGSVDVQPYELLEDGRAIFQGDIVLPLDKDGNVRFFLERTKSTGYRGLLWTNATIPYDIDPALTIASTVQAAVNEWQAATGMRMVRRTTEPDFVWFTTETRQACFSPIGRVGGQQNITLNTACSMANVMHEIGHSAGLFHEQSRTDRDTYVTLHLENADPTYGYAFDIFDPAVGFNSGPYDYSSIMHYYSYAFSINGQPTITKKDGSLIPFNSAVSDGDVNGVRSLYGLPPRPNLLQNGNFEAGVLSPWAKYPSAAPGIVAVESCCGNQTPGGTWDGYIQPQGQYVEMFQKVNVTAGRTYRLSVTVATKGMTAKIEWFSDASGDHVCTSTSVRWPSVIRLTCDIPVPVGTTKFNVGLSGNSAAGNWALSDDWSLIDITP